MRFNEQQSGSSSDVRKTQNREIMDLSRHTDGKAGWMMEASKVSWREGRSMRGTSGGRRGIPSRGRRGQDMHTQWILRRHGRRGVGEGVVRYGGGAPEALRIMHLCGE